MLLMPVILMWAKVVLGFWVCQYVWFWITLGISMRVTGQVPPRSRLGHAFMNCFSHVCTWIGSGTTRVFGLENLEKCKGRRVMAVVCNRADGFDRFRAQKNIPLLKRDLLSASK